MAGDTVESWFDELKKHVEMCPTTSPTTGSPTTSATSGSPTTSPTEGCALSEDTFYTKLQEFLAGPGGRFTKDIKFQKDSNNIILSSR